MVRPTKPPGCKEVTSDHPPSVTEEGTSPITDSNDVTMNGGGEEPPISPQLGVDETALVTLNDSQQASIIGSGVQRNSAILVDGQTPHEFVVCSVRHCLHFTTLHSCTYALHLYLCTHRIQEVQLVKL